MSLRRDLLRGGWLVRVVVAVTAVTAALLVAPAVASACPSFASVKSFHGTASASFDRTATASDSSGNITTVTLDRVADGLQFPKLVPVSLGHGLVLFSGGPEGGLVTVNDSYQFTSSNGGNNDSGGQTASGPTLGYPTAGNGGISFYPARFGCRYGVIFSFAIPTTQVGGSSDVPHDTEAVGLIYGPERPIPANLELSGTATVSWGADPSAGNGSYAATATGTSEWEQAYTNLLQQSGAAPGTATISWNFTPEPTSCSVGNGTIASAAARPFGGPLAGVAQRNPPTSVDLAALCKKLKVRALKITVTYANVQSAVDYAAGAAIGITALVTLNKELAAYAGIATALGGFWGRISSSADSLAKDDPPDPDWRSIAQPHPIGPATVNANAWLTPNAAKTLSGVFKQSAIVNGLEHAAVVSANRAGSARKAHSAIWVTRQTRALGRYAIRSGQAIAQLITLIRRSDTTLSAPFRGLTLADLKRVKTYARRHGLPAGFVRLAKSYGLPASTLAAVRQRLESGAELPTDVSSIYGLLSNPKVIAADQKAADALQTYGRVLLANS